MNFEVFWETVIEMGSASMQWIVNILTTNQSSALGYMWLIVAIFLLILEISVPGLFFFISIAAGSSIASLCAFLDYSLYVQCFASFTTSMIFLSVLKYITSNKKLTTYKNTHTNADALIGQQALVVLAIEPRTPGRVKVRGEEWPALSVHGTACHQGSVVTVVRIEGNKLIVM